MVYDKEEIIAIVNKFNLTQDDDFNYGNVSTIIDNLIPEGWDYVTGCTKCVLIPPASYDYVVKLPFTYDFFENEYETYPFEGAYHPLYGNYDWDYCQAEVEYYDCAAKTSVAPLFAETKFLGYTDKNFPVYIQERCDSSNVVDGTLYNKDVMKRSRDIGENSRTLYRFKYSFLAAILMEYNEDMVHSLDDFIEEYEIQDMHDGNYGYKYNSYIPKIYDFSGYNG